MTVLVVDVGGTHVKALATGRRRSIRFDSGPHLTAAGMVRELRSAIADWSYDRVTIGYPGPVVNGRPLTEPHNLGGGWVGYDFRRAFGCPVRVINDAAMQALGSYQGGRMLFLGLGTGLGTATVDRRGVQSLELAHLPYREGRSYEDYAGIRGLDRLGHRKWQKHVHIISELLRQALVADYVVLGGGNSARLQTLPPNARLGDNSNAFRGGFRLWEREPDAAGSRRPHPPGKRRTS